MRNQTRVTHLPELGNAMLLQANFTTQRFSAHYHPEYAIGVIEAGTMTTRVEQQRKLSLSAGSIIALNPGDVHTGEPVPGSGRRYRILYFEPSLLLNVIGDLPGNHTALPRIVRPVIPDAQMANQLDNAYRLLEQPQVSLLEKESHLLVCLRKFLARYGEIPVQEAPGDQRDNRLVDQVRAYMDAHYYEDITLAQLALRVNMSAYHFLRVFKAATGLPPHAFLTQIRIEKSKQLLMAGRAIVDVALAVGFYDQSHFTRQFKRYVGATPRQFRQHRNFVQ